MQYSEIDQIFLKQSKHEADLPIPEFDWLVHSLFLYVSFGNPLSCSPLIGFNSEIRRNTSPTHQQQHR